MQEAKIKEENEEFDSSVIFSAMERQKLKKVPEHGNNCRSRKAIRADIYVKDSLAVIKDIEK